MSEELLLADNHLTALPSGLAQLRNLRTLDAGHNLIVEVPELPEITDFLYLHDNRIRSMSFKSLGRLRYLNLGDNPLDPLTDEIALLSSLEELRLENSGLTSLPDAIGRLANLTELALRKNALATLPAPRPARKSIHGAAGVPRRATAAAEARSALESWADAAAVGGRAARAGLPRAVLIVVSASSASPRENRFTRRRGGRGGVPDELHSQLATRKRLLTK